MTDDGPRKVTKEEEPEYEVRDHEENKKARVVPLLLGLAALYCLIYFLWP